MHKNIRHEMKRSLTLSGHTDWVTGVAIHPAQNLFATWYDFRKIWNKIVSSADKTIKLWDIKAKKAIQTMTSTFEKISQLT